MSLNRREFLAGAAACAGALCSSGCTLINPVPTFDTAPDGGFELPPDLSRPGGQVKARIPDSDVLVLVWRTEQGYGAATITCTHLGSEVHLNLTEKTLDCPSHGSRYGLDGKVVHWPAKQPLQPYKVVVEGSRLIVRPG